MATLPDTMGPPPATTGPVAWARKNLFNSWFNTLLTIAVVTFLYFLLKAVLTWVFWDAAWEAVGANLKLFLVGQYPNEELWRVGVVGLMIAVLVGLSWGVWGGIARTAALVIAAGVGIPALIPVSLHTMSLDVRLWLLAVPALIGLGFLSRRLVVLQPRWVLISWVLAFFLTLLLLRGFGGSSILPHVGTGKWGGLMLTFLLALVGIVASFPFGILLALGRRSSLPVLSLFSIVFIEGIRGVPLVALLFMTQIILPLLLPEDFIIDRVVRALVAITVFSAAYMAENVRGGLQAVPQGQIEAARALGLPGRQVILYIVLPQALRAVIPAIVGQFISLFKDTSLVVIVGLLDILGIGKSIILGTPKWIGSQREVYVFVAAMFWIFTYSMSYASRKLEAQLGVGKR